MIQSVSNPAVSGTVLLPSPMLPVPTLLASGPEQAGLAQGEPLPEVIAPPSEEAGTARRVAQVPTKKPLLGSPLRKEVSVTMRLESDATVLEWAGPREARYRVTRSFEPDFEAASYLEFIEVEGLSYRDRDPRSGMRFYRVERIG